MLSSQRHRQPTPFLGISANNTDRYPIADYEDDQLPTIGTPTLTPSGSVPEDQEAKVTAEVTDTKSGVRNVSLSYTTGDGGLWTEVGMNLNSSPDLYEFSVPDQPYATPVRYKMEASDSAGNNATLGEMESYLVYDAIPELQPLAIILLAGITLLRMQSRSTARNATHQDMHRQLHEPPFFSNIHTCLGLPLQQCACASDASICQTEKDWLGNNNPHLDCCSIPQAFSIVFTCIYPIRIVLGDNDIVSANRWLAGILLSTLLSSGSSYPMNRGNSPYSVHSRSVFRF